MPIDMFLPVADDRANLLPVHLDNVGCYPAQTPVIRPSGMPFHQLFVVTHGYGEYTSAGKTFSLSPGTHFYVPKDVAHVYRGDAAFTTRWVGFDGPDLASILTALNLTEPCAFNCGTHSDFYYAQKAIMELRKTNPDYTVFSAQTYNALICFAQLYNTMQKQTDDNLDAVIDYMQNSYSKAITLEELAMHAKMSRYTFCRTFKKVYGQTPFAFLLRLRVQEAKHLLANQRHLPLSEIAGRCGFADASYFIKCFKRIEHMTPLEFRKTRL